MKKRHRDAYLQAVVEHIVHMTTGKARPVVVNAYLLFDRACTKADLVHPYSRGESRDIIRAFADEIMRQCLGFGVTVMKIPARMLELVPHGSEAILDEKRTPKKYEDEAMLTRGNQAEALALFGNDCNEVHPMLYGDLKRHYSKAGNTVCNFNKRVKSLKRLGQIDDDVATELLEANTTEVSYLE